MEHNETRERFARMFDEIFRCIRDERPFVEIAQIMSDGLKASAPAASREWPNVVYVDILDAEYISED